MDLTNFMRPFFPICDIFCIFAERKIDFIKLNHK